MAGHHSTADLAGIARQVLPLPRSAWNQEPDFDALSVEQQGVIELADLICRGEALIGELALLGDHSNGVLTIAAVDAGTRSELTWITLAAVASEAYITGQEGELRDAYAVWLAAMESA